MVLTRRNNGRDLTWEEQMITSIGLQDRIVENNIKYANDWVLEKHQSTSQ